MVTTTKNLLYPSKNPLDLTAPTKSYVVGSAAGPGIDYVIGDAVTEVRENNGSQVLVPSYARQINVVILSSPMVLEDQVIAYIDVYGNPRNYTVVTNGRHTLVVERIVSVGSNIQLLNLLL